MAASDMKFLPLAAIALSLLGCDRPSSPSAASAPATTAPATTAPATTAPVGATAETKRREFAGADFVVPSGWTVAEDMGGLLLTAPEVENDWQANVFLELRRDAEQRPLEQALEDLVPKLKSRKAQFQEVGREIGTLPSGLRCATLEYTCFVQGTPLTEQEVVIELAGGKRFFVLTSTASASRTKYRPVFQSLVESLRAGRP